MSMKGPAANRGSIARVRLLGGVPSQRERVARTLSELGVRVASGDADVIMLIESSGLTLDLSSIRQRHGASRVIVVTDCGSEQLAVNAFRAGADDYLAGPLTPVILTESFRRIRHQTTTTSPKPEPVLLGDSEAINNLRAVIGRIAVTSCSVLITGETGTGKDVVARLLHEGSHRSRAPFVSINCSALPDTLFESELFGYERGAFTGAQTASTGRLQSADGGTVFLDEVGELSLTTQPKLLRVIDQREVQRLGSRRHETIDVRWIAATNRDLQQSIRQGLFRADLFYRLNVYSLAIPPLRARPEDVVVLAQAFLTELALASGRPDVSFSDEAITRLMAYDWPGNVRELRNVVESSLLNTDSPEIGVDALPSVVRGADFTTRTQPVVERVRVVEALRASGGNKSEAAHRLNWSRMTLYRKLARHRIDVTSERDSVTAKPPRV